MRFSPLLFAAICAVAAPSRAQTTIPAPPKTATSGALPDGQTPFNQPPFERAPARNAEDENGDVSAPPLVNAPGGEPNFDLTPPDAAPYQAEPPLPAAEMARLRAPLEQLEKQLQAGAIPADRQNLALLRFKIEQARLIFSYLEEGVAASPTMARRALLAHLKRAQSIAAARGDAVYPAPSPMHERAYIAANDGSAQPFWVFVPDDYSPRKTYPLIVFLHGYSPTTSKVDPWLPDEGTWRLATKRESIIVLPYGRRNTDFVDVGEDDTLRVTEEVKRLYSIDAARVFLMGPSMGGFGVYAIGMHHPDRWTALSVMSARSDFYLWFGLDRGEVAPWKRPQYDADDPRTLARNALGLPIYTQHGALDAIVSVEQSRRLGRDMRALNYPFSYREIPDGDHFIYFQNSAYDSAFDWMKTVRPRPTAPRRVVYLSSNARNDGAYWTKIDAFENYALAARLEANLNPDNTLEVTTENVAAWTLSPPPSLLKKDAPLRLKLNGTLQSATYDAAKPIHWDSAIDKAPQSTLEGAQVVKTALPIEAEKGKVATAMLGSKTARRVGPMKNSYRDPFLLVYGTLKIAAGKENADEIAARSWAQEWQIYADGVPPIKADTQVTPLDRANYNLILFGSTASNSLLAEIGAQLPLEWKPDGYRIATKSFTARNHGVQFCFPSPFSKERMIVVQSGATWGEALPVNHKLDLLPDYIVFDRALDPSDKTNHALRAGFFDRFWQLPTEK